MKKKLWKSTTPDPDITLTADTLILLLDRMYRYYGIAGGLRKHVLSDVRRYGFSQRSSLKIWRE